MVCLWSGSWFRHGHWVGEVQVYTDGLGGARNADPRLRRCGWAWIVNSSNGDKAFSPVAYHGEYGTMDGKQTVPRAELTAVIRALLAWASPRLPSGLI
eukprot:10120207-Karenia_brevis.AAC.1